MHHRQRRSTSRRRRRAPTFDALGVGGNLTNNGVLDLSTNGGLAGAGITFTGAASNTFGGTGATTDIRSITVNKGTSTANILELNPSNFTVHGGNTDGPGGYLTLTNGTFKISGSFPMTNRTFDTADATPSLRPAASGSTTRTTPWPRRLGGTTTANNGLFRVTQGTYNIGIGAGDQMRGGTAPSSRSRAARSTCRAHSTRRTPSPTRSRPAR